MCVEPPIAHARTSFQGGLGAGFSPVRWWDYLTTFLTTTAGGAQRYLLDPFHIHGLTQLEALMFSQYGRHIEQTCYTPSRPSGIAPLSAPRCLATPCRSTNPQRENHQHDM